MRLTKAAPILAAAALLACSSTDDGAGAPSGDPTESPAVQTPPSVEPVAPGDEPEPAPGPGPSDDDPDRDADPAAPSPEDTTTPPATQAELVKAFAPHLHLSPDDAYRPANVDWYLARVTMRYNHDKCPDHEILGLGKVTQAALVAQSHRDNKALCQHDAGDVRKSTSSDLFFLEVQNHATYKGAPRAEWKEYVVWRPQASGLVNIEYWTFYPFNDGFSVFNHEADWEHVRVTVDPKANGGQGRAVEIKLSAHKGGTILKPGDASLTMEGTHPVAYVAKGTHANYAKPGTYDIEGTAGIAKDTAKAAAAADVWKTEGALVVVGTRSAPKNGQEFVKYWGRWGEIGNTSETSGVTRHFP
ncbi:MAG: Vps62-related protein [Labilithrix sp.]|nr:Vps62-related protein [Labilithrix sp.]